MAQHKKAAGDRGKPDTGNPLSASSLTLSQGDLEWLKHEAAVASAQLGQIIGKSQTISKSQIVRAMIYCSRIGQNADRHDLHVALMTELVAGRVWGSVSAVETKKRRALPLKQNHARAAVTSQGKPRKNAA